MKKLIIFGNSNFSKLIKWYIDHDDDREVVAFCADQEYIIENVFEGLPVIAFEEIEKMYPPEQYEILIGIGYNKMNDLRKKIYYSCKQKGYTIASYIHSSSLIQTENIGEGNIILEQTLIEPFVKIGNCNLIWYKVSIAHDDIIGNFNTIAGMASLCGHVIIKNNCFVGNASVIRESVIINDYSLIGASAFVGRDVEPFSVVVPQKSVVLEGKKSTDFM
ncbi:acetyltransferase [Bacillus sp. EB600]|uniref:acetyltransferase n=1 Tax=Bacillus sp. EB600 TaxID=2806345 RepID=UPI002109BEA4|nr:acetyltransferase [Bacillus sp. EB600]MCQ6280002.1 acetyltransferase [Bacillus sp. EB600]